jgi:16S rRNA processing protein RimM
MITLASIQPVGKFLKPHGVNGEIAVLRDYDELDFEEFSCIVVDIDGIFVPFFINSVRSKGAETDLLSIDGIEDEVRAAGLSNKTVYVLKSEVQDAEEDGDGFYADDFIGYKVDVDGVGVIGEITGIEDSTANYLFIVETADGKSQLIPVADEFITDIDQQTKTLVMDLPEGLLDM